MIPANWNIATSLKAGNELPFTALHDSKAADFTRPISKRALCWLSNQSCRKRGEHLTGKISLCGLFRSQWKPEVWTNGFRVVFCHNGLASCPSPRRPLYGDWRHALCSDVNRATPRRFRFHRKKAKRRAGRMSQKLSSPQVIRHSLSSPAFCQNRAAAAKQEILLYIGTICSGKIREKYPVTPPNGNSHQPIHFKTEKTYLFNLFTP